MIGKLPLRYSADYRSISFVCTLIFLLASQWLKVIQGWHIYVLTCILAFVACIVKHNHQHCATFKNRTWNKIFQFILSISTGQPSTGIITAHNINHHGKLDSEDDFVRSTLVHTRWNLLNLIMFPIMSVWQMYRNKPSDLQKWKKQNPDLYDQAKAERVITYSFVVTLLVLNWYSTLTYLIVPWVFAQWCLLSINLLQHQDCDIDSQYNHSRNITGKFTNWLLLNNGYHTAHHIKPGLHWSLLPAFHKEQIQGRIASDLEESSLAVALWKQFFSIKAWNRSCNISKRALQREA